MKNHLLPLFSFIRKHVLLIIAIIAFVVSLAVTISLVTSPQYGEYLEDYENFGFNAASESTVARHWEIGLFAFIMQVVSFIAFFFVIMTFLGEVLLW